MPTPKVSRGVNQGVRAISPAKALRRSLRSFAYNAPDAEAPTSPPHSSSGSELSDAPSSPEDPQYRSDGKPGKRKRASKTTGPRAGSRLSSRKAPKLEHDPDVLRKPLRQPTKKVKQEGEGGEKNDGQVTIHPPPNWEEIYSVTQEMRKHVLAPVDTMGCESLAEQHCSPRDRRLQTLIALMLSSQTKDTVNAVAMENLKHGLRGGFNLEALLEVEPTELNAMINKVGFHNNKTKFIKQVAPILRDKFDGDIPDTIEGLVSLPGVGPKMAYLTMSAAWGRDEGIGVDVHVHRITNLWGWHKTSTPEQTRAALEAWLPREKWHDINHLLVGFGQTICLPVGRRCDECDLNTKNLCPSAVAVSARKKKIVKKEIKSEDGTVVKQQEETMEADDVAATVKIKCEDVGEVEMQTTIPDIEDIAKV